MFACDFSLAALWKQNLLFIARVASTVAVHCLGRWQSSPQKWCVRNVMLLFTIELSLTSLVFPCKWQELQRKQPGYSSGLLLFYIWASWDCQVAVRCQPCGPGTLSRVHSCSSFCCSSNFSPVCTSQDSILLLSFTDRQASRQADRQTDSDL